MKQAPNFTILCTYNNHNSLKNNTAISRPEQYCWQHCMQRNFNKKAQFIQNWLVTSTAPGVANILTSPCTKYYILHKARLEEIAKYYKNMW